MIGVVERTLAFTAVREGCVQTMYPDSHNPAIGFGQNDPSLKPGDTISVARACEMLVAASKSFEASILKAFHEVALTQPMFDALFSLTYNVGGGGLAAEPDLIAAFKAYAINPDDHGLRDLAGLQLALVKVKETGHPFNLSRRLREGLILTAGDYGDLTKIPFWSAGKNPRVDKQESLAMPPFLKAAA